MSIDQIIVPLDISTEKEAISLIDRLPEISFWKVGLELFVSSGGGIINILKERQKSAGILHSYRYNCNHGGNLMKRRQLINHMLFTVILIGSHNVIGCTTRPPKKVREQSISTVPLKEQSKPTVPFTFKVNPFVKGNANTAEELRQTIIAFWQDYLRMDTPNYITHWTSDAIRLSGRSGVRQVGISAIESGLSAEWEAFERPHHQIAERMTVKRAEFEIEGNYAIALYWIDVKGGVRWHYTDQGLVFQAFIKQDKEWKIAHHTDTWSLDYDIESQKPGTASTVDFDFAYPVTDLNRAIKFYTPLLGEPESVTPTRASFNVNGGHFILDSNTWGGVAQVRPELPNGYALFLVADAKVEMSRLKNANVKLLGKPQTISGDTYGLGLDLDQNVFVLWEPDFHSTTNFVPTVKGFPTTTTLESQAKRVMTAWLTLDAETLKSLLAPESTWFDDTRLKHRGQERNSKILSALKAEYWPRYDRGTQGITATMEIANFQTLTLGSSHIVSYDLHLHGQGTHPFRDSAWVTQVFNSDNQVVHTLIVNKNHSTAPVLELDYTGYPVEDIKQARQFYTKKLGLGEGYADEDYYGFWSNYAVFGLYQSNSKKDRLPQPRHTNGYMSFWVRSVEKIYPYLKQNGCSFPVIPAINDHSGIDKQPGYTQLVTTDSEGNVILLTEYSGKRH